MTLKVYTAVLDSEIEDAGGRLSGFLKKNGNILEAPIVEQTSAAQLVP
jgi:hypothetical protein